MTTHDRVKALATGRDWSMKRLACEMGISYTRLWRMLRQDMRLSTLRRLSAVLGVGVGDLLEGGRDDNPT